MVEFEIDQEDVNDRTNFGTFILEHVSEIMADMIY